MKNYILLSLLMITFSGVIYSQNSNSIVKVGDVFTIGEVDGNNYKYINFPKTNFIIKKGGIANYNRVKGEEVAITSIKENKDGNLIATIKLTSEKYFFRSHKYITVQIDEAINEKELLKI